MDDLKTILITGGTDGLGRAAAVLLAERGYRVLAAGRSAEKRAALDLLARERGLPLETLEMDVCDDASVERAMETVRRKAGAIDALVNSAGVAYVATMEEITLEDLRRQFETNVFGVVRVTQCVLPAMRKRRCGRIINMSSVAGRVSNPLFGPYSGSKFALEAMSDALRLEVLPFGIHVVLVEPGYIPTGMERASVALSARYTHRAVQSDYGAHYQGFLEFWKKATRNPRYKPGDCARVILRALEDTPPKPRYTVTRDAWLTVLLRRVLTDRALDRLTRRALGLKRIAAGARRGGLDPAAAQAALEELARRERP